MLGSYTDRRPVRWLQMQPEASAGRLLIAIARGLAVAATLGFAYVTLRPGAALAFEGTSVDPAFQYVFLIAGILATALAWLWPPKGGFVMLLLGLTAGIAAAARFSEETALTVGLAYVVPGLLFMAAPAFTLRPALRSALVAGVATIIAVGVLAARDAHDRAFGPAHPQSNLVAIESDWVEWAWAGAVTSSGATVTARFGGDVGQVRLVAFRDETFASPVYSDYVDAKASAGAISLRVEGLEPAARYFYGFEVDGSLEAVGRGSFETFPDGPATFSVLVGACARNGSNGAVFDTMRAEDAVLYIITGDLHYENIATDNVGKFRDAYANVVSSPAQAALYAETPVAYVWDDHDFGGNDSTGSSEAREAARIAYRESVPHYELPAGDGDAAIHQAFTIGDVRFVMTDTRSERGVEAFPGGGESMLGAAQREWLLRELLVGSETHRLVVWVSSVPWIADGESDTWGGFPEERAAISEFIAANGIRNLLMLAGDAHMLAIDDGRNSDYSGTGGAGFPILHAAALDRDGSTKGGPFSEGMYPGPGQYGLVTFIDNGDSIDVQLSGRNWRGEEVVGYRFTVPARDASE